MDQLTDMPADQNHTEFDKVDEPLYKPLDDTIPQIRLVKVNLLQPHEATDTMIKCSMKTVSLHEVEDQYIALSYTWGNLNDRKPININGHRYLVTVNLEAFLHQWRDSALQEHNDQDYSIALWIDAICINQEDLLERKSQVMMMSKIYPSAKGTLSWLGRGSNSCECGLASIRTLGKHVEHSLEENDRADYLKKEAWPIGFYLQDANAKGFFKNFAWNGIHDLFSIEYWVRAWIQQEFALAKDVMFWYGKMAANMRHVRSVRERLRRIEDQNCPDFFNRSLWIRLTKHPYRSILAMHGPLLRFDYLQYVIGDHTMVESPPQVFFVLYHFLIAVRSTDPRDLLYSLLGMMDLSIEANYEQTVEEAYYQFAEKWIAKPCGLIFLLGAGGSCPVPDHHQRPEHCSLPSWVPCWTSLKAGSDRIGIDVIDKGNSGADIRHGTVKIAGRRLRVKGYMASRVKWDKSINAENLELFLATYLSEQTATGSNTTGRRLQLLLRLIYTSNNRTSRRPLNFTSSSWVEILSVLTSVMLVFSTRFSLPLQDIVRWIGIHTNGDVAEKLLDEPIPPGIDPSEPAINEDSNDLSVCGVYLEMNLIEHTIFTTVDGHIGWSPRELREDDIVCTLFGLKTPVILRKVDDSFRYISPCSIQGLMDENPPKLDIDPAKIQTFDIY